MFIAIKTDDGRIKGKNSFYCKVLHVSSDHSKLVYWITVPAFFAILSCAFSREVITAFR